MFVIAFAHPLKDVFATGAATMLLGGLVSFHARRRTDTEPALRR